MVWSICTVLCYLITPHAYVLDMQVYPEGTHLMIPWFERPIIYDVRARPNLVESTSGSRDLQMVSSFKCFLLLYCLTMRVEVLNGSMRFQPLIWMIIVYPVSFSLLNGILVVYESWLIWGISHVYNSNWALLIYLFNYSSVYIVYKLSLQVLW